MWVVLITNLLLAFLRFKTVWASLSNSYWSTFKSTGSTDATWWIFAIHHSFRV
jgi:hypothetical protein